jgi:hypothetical protein
VEKLDDEELGDVEVLLVETVLELRELVDICELDD